MFGLKRKSKTNKVVKQSSDITNLGMDELARWLSVGSGGYADNYTTYLDLDFDRARKTTSPLNDAVGKILDHLIGVAPQVEVTKEKSKEYLPNSEILTLLKNPNQYTNYSNFIKELGVSYLTFGNAYYIIGFVGDNPTALTAVSDLDISIQLNTIDGYPDKYTVGQNTQEIDYVRTMDKGVVKFIYEPAGQDISILSGKKSSYQLIHIKNYCTSGNFKGESKLVSLMDDIILFNVAYLFNRSVLKNGGRISGLFTQQDGVCLSDNQIAQFMRDCKELYGGASNAGNTLLCPPGFEYKQMSINPKDMDFASLIKETSKNIYNAFNIPLALVGDSSLSLANMETAMGHLYKSAVLPLVNTLFLSLTSELLPYFEDDDTAKLSYNPWDVTALIPELMDGLKKASELGVVTINEQRQKLGLAPIINGDEVLIASNLIPVGEVDDEDEDEDGDDGDES